MDEFDDNSIEEDFDDEMETITLSVVNGEATIHKEPFATIECETEEDWNILQNALKLKDKVKQLAKDQTDTPCGRMLKELLDDTKH